MADNPPEIRIAVIGNVDSGKTTTTSVITGDILDDGKGAARTHILKHPHEKNSGRTSSIAQSIISRNHKIFTFVDLAGHEKYLKTTVSGLNGYFIDYAIVVIGADRGIIGMTKEHLIVAMSLKIPVIIVITKIDVAVDTKLDRIRKRLNVIFSGSFAGKKHLKYANDDTINDIINTYNPDNKMTPVFEISNKTGDNIENMKNFIFSLTSLKIIGNVNSKNPKFVIDSRFKLPGVGLVVTGLVQDGLFLKNKEYFLGPFNSTFKKVSIRSVHNNFKENVEKLKSGEGGCFNIKFLNPKEKVDIDAIRKGHLLVAQPSSFTKFKAQVEILHHPTTIKTKYEPTIHCGIVRQVATITEMDHPLIRTGDKANVIFNFKYHPEYIEVGDQITFREGRTKGIGVVTEILS